MSAEWPRGPDSPEAPVDEVHVWRAEIGPVAAREVRSAGRNALRRVLGRYLDREPAAIELAGGEHGKPALAGERPPLRFNLSHSARLALIAVTAEREVGVDVELADGKRDVMRLAEAGLAPEEAAAVRSAPPGARAVVFYSAWVRKEAVAKCLGVGIGAPLPPVPASVSMLDVDEAYSAALAIAAPQPLPIRRYSLPAGDRAYFL
jgi:4'-phosphopantetheinyl transferase